MKTKLLSLPAFFLLAALSFGQDNAKDELAKFQGNWAVESMTTDGEDVPADVVKAFKMTFKGDNYRVVIGAEMKTDGTIILDTSKKPKVIDIVPDNGPDRGKKQPGIYEIDGDKLKICAAQPGKERPATFETKGKVGYTLMILRREK
jgi:uncharacterized protein (TIGR03067 family)